MQVSAAVAQIQTENAKISTAVQNRMVDELPLVVGGALRSPFNLVTVTPEARGDGGTLSLGGGQAAAWNATLDGISVTTNRAANTAEIAYNAPSVEAITEFTVDTNGFKAEYGQAGGGVMTFVSKSGTNQIHGSAYDFLRNDKLDARGFFPLTKSVYKQNDFGATLGGPVYLPSYTTARIARSSSSPMRVSATGWAATRSSRRFPRPRCTTAIFQNGWTRRNRLLQIYDPATTRQNPAAPASSAIPLRTTRFPSRDSARSARN